MYLLKVLSKALSAVLLALLLLAATERPAMAYADPGSGALIWQAVVGGAVGLMFYFRRILVWFRSRGHRS